MKVFGATATAVLLSLVCGFPTASAQVFGELLTTPQEREYLDFLRQDFLERNQQNGFDIEELPPEIPVVEEEGESTEVREFHLGGIFLTGDGNRTIWLNRTPVPEADLPANVQVIQREGMNLLQIESDGTRYLLKAGQSVDLNSGAIWDSYQRPAQPVPANEEQTTDVVESTDADTDSSESAEAEGEDPRLQQLQAILNALERLETQ